MTTIDLGLLAAIALFAILVGVTLRLPGALTLAVITVISGLAIAQLALEGPYWHLLPAYLLALTCLAVAMRGAPPRGWLVAAALRILMLALLGATLLGWVLLPVPILAPPSGPYAVGTSIFRWIDAARDEPMTADEADHRNVTVQAWYPAPASQGPEGAPYLDGLGRLPPTISLLPSAVMVHYDRIATAPLNAPLSTARPQWPVVIFSPGYGATRSLYASLLRDLASRGFVVLALDHPFEAAVTELADGSIATPVEKFLPDDPRRQRYMEGRLSTRVADLRFVLDQLSGADTLGPLQGHLDTARIAAIGHSFGGATAFAAMVADPRLVAAVDIDGALYGPAVGARLSGPAMVIDSDHAVTGHDSAYLARTADVLAHAGTPSYRFELTGTHHYSFTDALFLLSPPARLAVGWGLGVTRDAAETVDITTGLIAAFLTGPLGGKPGDPVAVATRSPGIKSTALP